MKYWNRRKKYQLIYMLVDLLSAELIWGAFLIFRWLVHEGRMFSVDTVLIPMFNFYTPLILYPLGCLSMTIAKNTPNDIITAETNVLRSSRR